MGIPNHPWIRAAPDAAAVRIAMTVCTAGKQIGTLMRVIGETFLETDAPVIEFSLTDGLINADLTVGVDLTKVEKLSSNKGISNNGVLLAGRGFLLNENEANALGLSRYDDIKNYIRPYLNGMDLIVSRRKRKVIDLFGLTADDVRTRYPEIYQHLLMTVKPERQKNNRASYRESWWIFAEPRRTFRPALANLERYIATTETSKHRHFQLIDASTVPDHMVVVIASADAFDMGVLSSSIHVSWALRAGARLGIGNDPRYSKSRCFDPFPFPDANEAQKQRIRLIAEHLDAHRKHVLAEHPHLTLTGLYNVLERVRAGARPSFFAGESGPRRGTGEGLSPGERKIFDDGLVLILKELHDKLDAAVAEAYGWPADLADDDILAKLVALNKERAAEEARGLVRWLRPDYQIPRFGSVREKAELDLLGGEMRAAPAAKAGPKPAYPADEVAQTAVVMARLALSPGALDAGALAATFKQGRKVAPKIAAVLLSLSRMGVVASGDGGATFALKRAA